jgi:large subunit ribosomal protein L9
MKIVLLEDVPKLGSAGDVTIVKDGYGRNFLIPTGKALLADPRNLKMIEFQKKVATSKAEREMKNHKAFAQRLAKLEVIAKVQTGEEDRMFGAVTSSDIAELLGRQGVDIDRRLIILDDPIKALGIYTVPVKLHSDVEAHVRVKVIKMEAAAKEE